MRARVPAASCRQCASCNSPGSSLARSHSRIHPRRGIAARRAGLSSNPADERSSELVRASSRVAQRNGLRSKMAQSVDRTSATPDPGSTPETRADDRRRERRDSLVQLHRRSPQVCAGSNVAAEPASRHRSVTLAQRVDRPLRSDRDRGPEEAARTCIQSNAVSGRSSWGVPYGESWSLLSDSRTTRWSRRSRAPRRRSSSSSIGSNYVSFSS